ITHPLPDPDPLVMVGQLPPSSSPISRPLSTSRRYIAVPALLAGAPPRVRRGDVSRSGKSPEPTITAVASRLASSVPTAGSDHVSPTVFSANVAVDFRSPNTLNLPPGVPSVTVKVCVIVGSKLE